ncbi:polycystin-1-like protein 2 [Synchiropus picturatus]
MCPSLRLLLILLTLACLPASGDKKDTPCPDNWTAFRTSCYQFVNYSRSFAGAQHWCEKGGGHLVMVADEETQRFLQTHLEPAEDFWVGLSQTHPLNLSSQAPLQWVDGSDLTYSNWVTATQPGSLCGYVLRNSSFQWEAASDCSRTLPFICQFETTRAVECRGSDSILQCRSGQVLMIDAAFFGRESPNYCPSTLAERNTLCPSVEVRDGLAVLCQGRPSCRLGGFLGSFDEPCPATESYLSVDYHCQGALTLSLEPVAAVFTDVTIEVKWFLNPEENLRCSLNAGDGHMITLDADQQGCSMVHQYSEAGDFTVTAECTNTDMHVTALEKITLQEPVSEFTVIKCVSGTLPFIDTDCHTIYGGSLEIQTAVKTGTDVSYTLQNGDVTLASLSVSRGNVSSNMSVSAEKVELLGPGCHQLTLQASNIVTVPHVTTSLLVCVLERISGLRAEILTNRSSCWSHTDFAVGVSVDSGRPVTLDFTLIGQESCSSEVRDMTARTDVFQIQDAFEGSVKLTIRAWNLFSSAVVEVEHIGCNWTMNDMNDFFSSYLSEQHTRVKRQVMDVFAQPSNEVFNKNHEITLSLDTAYHRKPDRTYIWSCNACKCEGPWETESHVITRECLPRPFHYFMYYLNEYKDGLLEHSEPICVTLTPPVVLPVNLTCVEGCDGKTITLANITMTCESDCPEVTWYIEDPRDMDDWNTTTRPCHEENNTRPLIDGQAGGSEYLVSEASLAWAQSENQDIVVVVTTDEDEPRYKKLTIEQPSSSSSSTSKSSKPSSSSSVIVQFIL